MKKTMEPLPGSAAESHVRPPNVDRFWEHFWPPKVLFERNQVWPPNLMFGRRTCMRCGGTFGPRTWTGQPLYKSSMAETGEFSPHFRPRWVLALPWFILDVFPSIFHALTSFMLIWRYLNKRASFGSLETKELRSLPSPSWIVSPLVLQEVRVDL